MKEIEVKIIEINKKKVEARLAKLGAKKAFEGKIEAIIMDYPDRRLKKNKQILRLRKMTDTKGKVQCVLTHKHQKHKSAKAKTAEETEFEIGSFEDMQKIFTALGLVKIGGMDKNRTSWKLGKSHVEIEKYLGKHRFVPCFLEIEGPSIKAVHQLAKKLGFSDKECLAWSSWDIEAHYKNK